MNIIFLTIFVSGLFLENIFGQDDVKKELSHHTIDGFRNPGKDFKERKTKDLFKMLIWERVINSDPDSIPGFSIERIENDGSYLRENRSESTITWIGHSTLLIQVDGLNILTDPVWSKRVSPVNFAGPKRIIAPGLELEDLPEIDIVLISHNHYDHLDKNVVEYLGSRPIYVVPLGVGSFFESQGINRYEELDWWDEIKINSMKIICTPAQHFSGRNLFDKNKTLWCSWLMIFKEFKIYFAGDTGYFSGFKEIFSRYGSIDITALPIGSYKPGWYMEPVHMNPEQSLDAFNDLHGKFFIPIHWGTYPLGNEPINEPPILLQKEIGQRKLDSEKFWIFKHGQTRKFKISNSQDVIKSAVQFSEHEF
jgi:L-ascorbate metabolism protein UlaG (beta-lactamase superfamily)